MKRKKKLSGQYNSIQNCNFEMRPAEFNADVCRALQSLAEAAKANAKALQVMAESLKGARINVESIITIEQPKDDQNEKSF